MLTKFIEILDFVKSAALIGLRSRRRRPLTFPDETRETRPLGEVFNALVFVKTTLRLEA